MKKTTSILFTVFAIQFGYSQIGIPKNITDSVSIQVIHYLQNKQADSIYNVAGEKFKSQIPGADFKSIAENQVFPLNNFQNVSFVKTVNGVNKYKVEGSPELQLLISLDKENKLETFLIQPFNPD
jgi:hypothetical protein